MPFPTVGQSTGSPEEPERPVRGKQQRIFSDSAVFCEKPSRNNRESSSLLDDPPKISLRDGTGNQFDHNRESIRDQQGINSPQQEFGAKVPTHPIAPKGFSVVDKKTLLSATPAGSGGGSARRPSTVVGRFNASYITGITVLIVARPPSY